LTTETLKLAIINFKLHCRGVVWACTYATWISSALSSNEVYLGGRQVLPLLDTYQVNQLNSWRNHDN